MSVGRLGVESVNSAAFNLENFLAEWPSARRRTWRVRAVLQESTIHACAWCARARRCTAPNAQLFSRELCQSCASFVPGAQEHPRVRVADACASFGYFSTRASARMTLAHRWVLWSSTRARGVRVRVALFSCQSWFLSFKSQISYF